MKHDMNMVRHHAPCEDRVPFKVEMKHSALDEVGNLRPDHPARSAASVQVSLDPFRMQFVQSPQFVSGERSTEARRAANEVLALGEPTPEHVRRKDVLKSERDGVCCGLAGPMREFGAVSLQNPT